MAAIQIETTEFRSVTFRSAEERSAHGGHLPRKSLLDQYQSDSGDELEAISWIMNAVYDRVRAISSTNANRPAQILVPELEPPFDQIQKLYFTRYNRDGDQETAIAVEAFFQDQTITGIIFIYPSGERAKIGVFDAVSHQIVSFPQDSRIIGCSIAGMEDELRKIEFEVESNEQPTFRRLSLPTQPPHTSGRTVPEEYNWREVWYQHATSAESNQRQSTHSAHDTVYNPPNDSCLVGIYVSCQGFSRVGALYEHNAPCRIGEEF